MKRINHHHKLKAILFLILLPFFLQGQLFINEFMTSNSSGITDADFNDTGDWIELYNNTNTTIDLSGYYLSDNLGDTTKWQFPIGTEIAATADSRGVG